MKQVKSWFVVATEIRHELKQKGIKHVAIARRLYPNLTEQDAKNRFYKILATGDSERTSAKYLPVTFWEVLGEFITIKKDWKL